MITKENTETIYDLISLAGEQHKDNCFLRYEHNDVIHEVTYRDFAADCMAIASWIQAQEARVGRPLHVAFLGIAGHHYLAGLLGVMCAGSISVPLDVQMDLDNLCDSLDRADVDILFYDWEQRTLAQGAKERLPRLMECVSLRHGRHVFCSDNILKEYAGQSVPDECRPGDLAMILFTSGTTGKSKGVMLSHGNLIDNVFCTTEDLPMEKEIYLNVLPIHHVFCLNGDVLTSLRYGNVLCLNQDMAKLVDHLRLFEPTRFRVVPMIAKSLYNRVAIASRQDPDRPIEEIRDSVFGKNIRRISSGGGYLSPDLAECYRGIGIAIAQGYGMSECSPKISSPDWDRPDKVASVGRIVDGCEVRVVDGEIQAKSPSVMMGYYKYPERTAEALTEDGWLCTGDLGYLDDEGFLYLTGRKKNLIILSNGENVAPELLENLFENERLVEEVLVYDENDSIVVEIYPNYKYAQTAGIKDIESAIQDIVKERNQALPTYEHMTKCRIREVPFEKTSSKKIIRGKHSERIKEVREQAQTRRLPETETQSKICDMVAAVLGHRRFGIDTDLFEAGLDSMGSVLLLSDLSDLSGFSVSLDDLFANPTIEALAALCESGKEADEADYTPKDVYPLAKIQTYFAYTMRGNTTANLPYFYKLDPGVDLERLRSCIEELFEIHPGLKSMICKDENGVYKTFRDDDRKIEIPITRMSDKRWEKERGSLLRPYYYEENEPLYHIGIYRTKQGNYLYFDIAHIVGDGMTMNILFEDLNALYAGREVPKESYTLFDYVVDEEIREKQGVRDRDIRYFADLMKGFKIRKCILTSRDCSYLDSGVDASIEQRFWRLNRREIQGFCRRIGVTENVLFLTAFGYCIGIFSGEKDTMATSIHSGRTDGRWNRLAGPLFLTYLFRYTNIPHETVPALLKRCGRQIMDTMRCHGSTLHGDEMFFQFQGDILNVDEIGGLPSERQSLKLNSLPFHLQVMTDADGYRYILRYWENRFDKDQLLIFMNALEYVIEAMLTEPSVRRLKEHLPDTMFPKHYTVKAHTINRTVGFQLIRETSPDMEIKAYVLDDALMRQPYGGWGTLYILNQPPLGWKDKATSPYTPGILYDTGISARILPDGSLDLLDQGGRTVLMERLTERRYVDLYGLERLLNSCEGIHKAEVYLRWGMEFAAVITADLYCSKEPDLDELNAYLKEHWDESLLPITFNVIREDA